MDPIIMLARRIIPCLLLQGDRLVKGRRFGDYRDAGNPVTTARSYDAQGADEMTLLDVNASREGRGPDLATIRKVAAECSVPLTVGGGIRSVETVRDCMAAGADKISVNGAILKNPELVRELARVYGAQAVVVNVTVGEDHGRTVLWDYLADRPVADRDPVEWISHLIDLGAGEIRLTAVHREGMQTGMDMRAFHELSRGIGVPVILEGGAGSLEHLDEALQAGADGLAIGSLLVFSDNNLVNVKAFLLDRGHHMRRP